MKIQLKSNKELKFPPSHTCFVSIKIDLIQNKPEQRLYEMRIIDEGYKLVDGIQVSVGTPVVRFKTMTYSELDQLAANMEGLDLSDRSKLRENINEALRQGLLMITNIECMKGVGMYFSEVGDFELVVPVVPVITKVPGEPGEYEEPKLPELPELPPTDGE